MKRIDKKLCKLIWVICSAGFAILVSNGSLSGQIRSGAAFLKMFPGARAQAMAESYTGMTDDLYALFANPGAAGFLRDWQWSANYTKWIADVYNASFLLGQRIRMPWSRQTRLVFGAVFQGMPEFNSADRPMASTQANDLLLLIGVGQPIPFFSQNISLGMNIKYFKSRLDKYRAQSWIFDTGISYRSPLFRLTHAKRKLFPFGQIAAGLAITQLGKPLKYVSAGTPLPQTIRAGISFSAGSHNGLQFQLALDYQQIRDDGNRFSLGGELSWNQLFALRGGYRLNRDPSHLLGRFVFGLSFRLDDHHANLANWVPGRNNAVRLDFAALQSQELFSGTYRGSINHYPIGPPRFNLIEPLPGTIIETDSVQLRWEAANDPDRYDMATYWLLVDTAKTAIAQTLQLLEQNPKAGIQHLQQANYLLKQKVGNPQKRIKHLKSGRHYWTVIAIDRDQHTRAMQRHAKQIPYFDVTYPDLQITDLSFLPSKWITQDDYQGKLQVTLTNSGIQDLKNISFILYDSSGIQLSQKNFSGLNSNSQESILYSDVIPALNAGDSLQIEIDWQTSRSGLHHIVGKIDPENRIAESDEANNAIHKGFYTIPKGTISAEDTATAVIFSYITYDLPFIAEVCFDSSSSTVKADYIRNGLLPAPLTILAKRLKANRALRVYVKGFADPNSGENDINLANQRAIAVRDSLINLGADSNQVALLPGEILKPRRLPRDPTDAIWILQERRYAKISANGSKESALFQPMRFVDIEPLSVPVTFFIELSSPVPFLQSALRLRNQAVDDSVDLKSYDQGSHLVGIAGWKFPLQEGENGENWGKKEISYKINIIDSLGRHFSTSAKLIKLASRSVLRDENYAWPLKFARTDPLYEFYWTKLYSDVKRMLQDKNMRMRFVGHACAIGPLWVNQALSERRAQTFQNRFLQYVQQNYPESYEKILARLDPPIGEGENVPLSIQHTSGKTIILGNNNSPLGRKLNRRIEIDFYSPEKPLQEMVGKNLR